MTFFDITVRTGACPINGTPEEAEMEAVIAAHRDSIEDKRDGSKL